MNHNRVLLQSGKGIGGIWRFFPFLFSIFKRTAPALIKKATPALKKIIKSSAVQDGLKQIKKKAVKSAVNSASDLISGRNPKDRLKKDMTKIVDITANAVSKSVLDDNNNNNKKINKKVKRKKRKNEGVYFGNGKIKKKLSKRSIYDY